jgi:hypothetical protein
LEDPPPRVEIVAWVGGQVLPHEDVRACLRGRGVAPAQIDDVVQDA